MDYDFDFGLILRTYPVLLWGLVVTLELWAPCFAAGLLLGLVVALGRLSRNGLARAVSLGYVELFRDTPVLIQLIWFFYAFPIIIGLQLSPFLAATPGLTLNTSAYCAELFRGGIESIAPGQWEGGRALGMRQRSILTRIVMPQVFRRMLPAFTNRAIELAKVSSLASVLAVHELMYQGAPAQFELLSPARNLHHRGGDLLRADLPRQPALRMARTSLGPQIVTRIA